MSALGLTCVPFSSVSEPIRLYAGLAAAALDSFQRLSCDWDPEVKPTAAALGAARLLAAVLDNKISGTIPHLAAGVGGGLQFEFRLAERELELEVLPSGEAVYLIAQGDDDQTGDLHLSRIQDQVGILVNWLFEVA